MSTARPAPQRGNHVNEDDPPPPSRARALAALVLLLALVAGGYVLARHLASVTKTEDCLMAGRRNCAPIKP